MSSPSVGKLPADVCGTHVGHSCIQRASGNNYFSPDFQFAAAVEASGTIEWKNEAKPRALILDLSHRSDEIGRLSAALRGMVAALYDRIDANEKFVGEVAQEIKKSSGLTVG